MTEKRFTNTDNGFIVDYESKQKVLNLYDVVELLNELHEENEQLKKDCTVLIYYNQEYRKENEQLKADKQALIDFIRKEFPKSYKHILEGFE